MSKAKLLAIATMITDMAMFIEDEIGECEDESSYLNEVDEYFANILVCTQDAMDLIKKIRITKNTQ